MICKAFIYTFNRYILSHPSYLFPIVNRIKNLVFKTFLFIFVIFFESCADQREYLVNLPVINGFEIKKVYSLNRQLLASYLDTSGNRLVFKFNENSATWKRIMFKTKVSFNLGG